MNVYVDASIVLRVVLNEPDPLAQWPQIGAPVASQLVNVECMRTIDRGRIRFQLDNESVAEHRAVALATVRAINLVPLSAPVLARAADPFPTMVGSLDAIHLATALLARDKIPGLIFATHDAELGVAARALGFDVIG